LFGLDKMGAVGRLAYLAAAEADRDDA
jgi:hypothetical protein